MSEESAREYEMGKRIKQLEAELEDYTEYNKLNHKNHCLQQRIDELEVKLSDQRKNRIATIDVVQESYELKDCIDELEAEVQELRHKSISDHATIVVLESLIAGIDPDLLDPKEAVCWEELHKKYYPEHYGR